VVEEGPALTARNTAGGERVEEEHVARRREVDPLRLCVPGARVRREGLGEEGEQRTVRHARAGPLSRRRPAPVHLGLRLRPEEDGGARPHLDGQVDDVPGHQPTAVARGDHPGDGAARARGEEPEGTGGEALHNGGRAVHHLGTDTPHPRRQAGALLEGAAAR